MLCSHVTIKTSGICFNEKEIPQSLLCWKDSYCQHFKQGKTLIKNFEFFKGTYEKRTHGKYHILNEILYNRYGKCLSSNTHPDWALLQEEAMEIKKD